MMNETNSKTALQLYVTKTIRSWLGIHSHSPLEVPLLPPELERLFLRVEESENSQRDQWGQWEHSFSENYWQGNLWVPQIDQWVFEQRRRLASQGEKLIELWPNGYKFAVCLSHDVDLLGPANSLNRALRSSLLRDGVDGVQRWLQTSISIVKYVASLRKNFKHIRLSSFSLTKCLQVELELDVKSSYFFTCYPLLGRGASFDCIYSSNDKCDYLGKPSSIKKVMQSLDEKGYDVGLHGSYYTALEPGMLGRQRVAIENALGNNVTTTRQHWLHWHREITPRLQEDAGLLADSTLGFNRNVGFRAGTSLPFFLYDFKNDAPLRILEVPLVFQDGAVNAAYALEYGTEMTLRLYKMLLSQINELGGCMTVLYHPDNRFDDPKLTEAYRGLIESSLNAGAWVTSLKEIQKWWNEREKLINP